MRLYRNETSLAKEEKCFVLFQYFLPPLAIPLSRRLSLVLGAFQDTRPLIKQLAQAFTMSLIASAKQFQMIGRRIRPLPSCRARSLPAVEGSGVLGALGEDCECDGRLAGRSGLAGRAGHAGTVSKADLGGIFPNSQTPRGRGCQFASSRAVIW